MPKVLTVSLELAKAAGKINAITATNRIGFFMEKSIHFLNNINRFQNFLSESKG
jgi:hypothetical protein